ncbi:MAG: hypothetical protein U9Q93_06810 [Pseudomonadota bacterium]|jgi:hypothetical protein|nr:hypothetical protein [Pseudomonadota bacterium]HCR79231.1 hypothetical protein [Alcanivorax sp.]|tara:strand:+ start:660 stop:884 length:225 start_codon:yes stop_codon:yes gene_type:complete
MKQHIEVRVPQHLPFLEAICWDLRNVRVLTNDEMLNRYERGWAYRGVLADLEGTERGFVKQLATRKGSWLQVDV